MPPFVVLWDKNRGNGNYMDLRFYESNCIKIRSVVWVQDASKICGYEKIKNYSHARVLLHPYAGTTPLGQSFFWHAV